MYNVVVVGAGLAGLAISNELARRGVCGVCVLEARSEAGGRIKSVYDESTKDILYESGPWRIPTSHRRVIWMFRSLGVRLEPMKTPTPPYGLPKAKERGLSTWEAVALKFGPSSADEADLSTSYAGQTHSASGSEPYSTDSKEYLVAPEGFSAAVRKLADGVEFLIYDTRVVDVERLEDGHYLITVSTRTGHNSFKTETMICHSLFVCVPPSACEDWTIFKKHARSVMCAVEPCELHHIYVEDAKFPRRIHSLHPRSTLSQTISSQYEGSNFFQASYTSGRLARLWQNLKLQSPVEFVSVLRRELRSVTRFLFSKYAPVKSHHWPVAFHMWSPVPDFDLKKAVHLSTLPNPKDLPNVYLAGEAHSSYQAWMEGALETAMLSLSAFFDRKPLSFSRGDTVVEGRVVETSKWALSHPGGTGAIINHEGEALESLMRHIGHSRHAWAVVHSLKKM